MKRCITLYWCTLALALWSSGIAPAARAQTAGAGTFESTWLAAETKQNLVSMDLLRFLGFFNISYTRALTPALSLCALLETPSNLITGFAYRESGIGVRLEARYNFSQKNLVGIFLAPVVGFNTSTFGTPSGSETFFTTTWTALGAMVGYQFAPFLGLPEILFGVGVGAEYNIISSVINTRNLPSGLEPATVSGTLPRFRFTIGYAF
ncbi:MAG: hypothetical protein RML40_06470 [Bacteroidota bacterium]|nr:hypothetical protein [Candidatus Kapabacteria bacterium]MDW8220160.1 hypothetical protein [Bacteroidota bacterium]